VEALFSQIVRIVLITRYFGSSMILAILFYLSIFLLLLALQPLVDLSLFFLRSFSTEHILYGVGCQPHAQSSTWRTRIFLFVWVIIFDLSVMGGPTTSYAPTA